MPSGKSSFVSRSMILKKIGGEQGGGQDAPLLDAVDVGKLPDIPLVLHLTLLPFLEMANDRETYWGTAKTHYDFPQSITTESIEALVRSPNAACRRMICCWCSLLLWVCPEFHRDFFFFFI